MEMRLFYQPEGRLRLECEDRCYTEVKPAWASPLSHPNRYLSLVDGSDREIVMFDTLDDVPADMRPTVERELKRRYLTSTIDEILEVDSLFGTTHWKVRTGRGERVFVTQSLHENSYWLAPKHIVIVDVDGNRFEIPDVDALDMQSKKEFWSVI